VTNVCPSEPLLEAADLARLANVTPATVRHAVRTGAVAPDAVTARGGSLFTRATADAWLATRPAARKTVAINFGFRVNRGSKVTE
jgi:hypothetical protein